VLGRRGLMILDLRLLFQKSGSCYSDTGALAIDGTDRTTRKGACGLPSTEATKGEKAASRSSLE